MQWSDTIRDFLPPVDPRSPDEVDGDIEDEFTFHLAMLEREERAAGCDDQTAKDHARKRFGDVERFRRKCRKIALEERVMLQRINLVLSIVVLLFVGLVGWQVWTTQKHNTLALQAITSDLARMKFEAEAEARDAAATTPRSRSATRKPSNDEITRNQLTGVWRLDDPTERLGDDVSLLVITSFRSDSGQTSAPAAIIQVGPKKHQISMQFLSSGMIVGRLAVDGEEYGSTQTFSGWKLGVDGELNLDLRAMKSEYPNLSHELEDVALVPLKYSRLTQPLDQRPTMNSNIAHVFGDVPSPGSLHFAESEQFTLQTLLQKSSVASDANGSARVIMMKDKGPPALIPYNLEQLDHPKSPRRPLVPVSVVHVIADDQSEGASDNAQVAYDLRDLPGVWRLVEREDMPEALEVIVIHDRRQPVPEGMIKETAEPAIRVTLGELKLAMELRFCPGGNYEKEEGMGVDIYPADKPYQTYNNPHQTGTARWQPIAANRLSIRLKPLLDGMTAETAAIAQPWFERPLVYERVTAPYTEMVRVGLPVHYHLLGTIANPGVRKMPAHAPLMLQDVLREQNFGQIEHGVAVLFEPGTHGPKQSARVPATSWEHEAYAGLVVAPDSVIYITREASPDADASTADIPPKSQGLVYIEGAVVRRGTYLLPAVGKLTLSRFLVSAGIPLDSNNFVTMRRQSGNAGLQDLMTDMPVAQLKDDAALDVVMEADDLVIVNAAE